MSFERGKKIPGQPAARRGATACAALIVLVGIGAAPEFAVAQVVAAEPPPGMEAMPLGDPPTSAQAAQALRRRTDVANARLPVNPDRPKLMEPPRQAAHQNANTGQASSPAKPPSANGAPRANQPASQ